MRLTIEVSDDTFENRGQASRDRLVFSLAQVAMELIAGGRLSGVIRNGHGEVIGHYRIEEE